MRFKAQIWLDIEDSPKEVIPLIIANLEQIGKNAKIRAVQTPKGEFVFDCEDDELLGPISWKMD